MSASELELVAWLTAQQRAVSAVEVGIGDDMAIVNAGSGLVLLTTDMLLDGVHFDRVKHDLDAIGRKAVACSLSDCAAMAVKPVAATVSVALPCGWSHNDSRRLYGGLRAMADAFDCTIVGGDTNAWNQRLAIDVTMLAVPYSGSAPVRRDGARLDDVLLVTGVLGGSQLGKHLRFTPRVHEARRITESLGRSVHALMDISDGLSLDLHRLCAASEVGAVLEERLLESVASPDAVEAGRRDGRSPLQHVLSDGEDFELLVAVDAEAAISVEGVTLHRVGSVVEAGVAIRRSDGGIEPLQPQGFRHLT